MPNNEEVYPLNAHIDPSHALIYGAVRRFSPRSDLPSPALMVPRPSTAGPIASHANHAGTSPLVHNWDASNAREHFN
jgi:hypothetical protein